MALLPHILWAAEYTSHRFPPFVRAMGLNPVPHVPAEPGIKRLGGGVLWQLQAGLCLSGVSQDNGRRSASAWGWIEHYNHQAPHSALGMQSPTECYAA